MMYAAYREAMEATARFNGSLAPLRGSRPARAAQRCPPPGYRFVGMYVVPVRHVPAIADIQARVAERYDIPLIEMTSARRGRDVARPRQVAMYLARALTPRSMPEIGRRFHRDHTTVIHACRMIEKLRASDPGLDADIQALSERLCAEKPARSKGWEAAL